MLVNIVYDSRCTIIWNGPLYLGPVAVFDRTPSPIKELNKSLRTYFKTRLWACKGP